MYDLNQMIDPSVGITLNGAVAINDNGQIVATDCNAEAFLLTPISEPSTIVQISIFLLVAAVFLSLRRTTLPTLAPVCNFSCTLDIIVPGDCCVPFIFQIRQEET